MNRSPLSLTMLWLLIAGSATCNDDRSDRYDPGGSGPDTFCRENPEDCAGEIGGACRTTDDCDDGVCCRDDGNCNGGMCLYRCSDDRDCPSNMLCEHDHCFFRCDSDADCGRGQSCEHGNTICEYD